MSQATPEPPAPKPAVRVLKRIAAWIVLAVIFYLLFRLVPPGEVIAEFQKMPLATLL